MFTDSPNLA